MKKIISFFVVLVMLFTMTTNTYAIEILYVDDNGRRVFLNDFIDTKNHWAHDIILKVAEYEWVVGNNGKFYPDNYIKRGDLALILDRMLGLKTSAFNMFYDLPNDSYYKNALLKCVALGYINGVANNKIDPEGFATREQVATIIARIFNLQNSFSSSTTFKDDSKISSWARNSVSALSKLGYMNGTPEGYVNPTGYITRAELVTLLNNIANSYIVKNEYLTTTSFTSNFPTNIITSEFITLTNSTVGRDIVLTYSSSGVTLNNTLVRGRILALGESAINVKNSEVSRIELLDGTSSVTGASLVDEVYVAFNASGSYLDLIPKKVILESGARLKIGSIVYENETTRTKTYYSSDLHAAISAEQGNTVGGPRVQTCSFSQDVYNNITVSNVSLYVGESDIKEIGVIWLEQEEKENTVLPTYQNKTGKKIYRTNKFEELIEFEVGEVENTCVYRFYALDKNGLFAYSKGFTFTEFDFDIKLSLYDENYPAQMQIEVIFEGKNVPTVSSVRCTYANSDMYTDSLKEQGLQIYKDPNAEVQPDTTKYKRYIGSIKSTQKRVNGEYVYEPPTSFGYIIFFDEGTIINEFPILSDVIPSDIEPTSELVTGSATYTGGNNIIVKNNRVTARYIRPQEVGVAYKLSNSSNVGNPSTSNWNFIRSNSNVDINESTSFNVNIPYSDFSYVYYCAYIKTSKGYWYGNVKSFSNNVQGDENGPRIDLGNSVSVLDENTIFLPINFETINPLASYRDDFVVDVRKNGVTDIKWENNSYEVSQLILMDADKTGYLLIKGLDANTEYEIDLQLKDITGLKSNLAQYSFNTGDYEKFTIGGKYDRSSDNGVAYSIVKPNTNYTITNSSFVDTNINGYVSCDIIDGEIISYGGYAGAKVVLTYKVKFVDTGYETSCLCKQIIELY